MSYAEPQMKRRNKLTRIFYGVDTDFRNLNARPKVAAIARAGGEPEPLHIDLMQLTSTTCRWAYGEDRFTFCGHDVMPRSSYCPHHARRARG